MKFILPGLFFIGVGLSLFWLRKDDDRYIVSGPLIFYRLFGILLIIIGLFAVSIGSGLSSIFGIPIHVMGDNG
jgi:hypothetical protein